MDYTFQLMGMKSSAYSRHTFVNLNTFRENGIGIINVQNFNMKLPMYTAENQCLSQYSPYQLKFRGLPTTTPPNPKALLPSCLVLPLRRRLPSFLTDLPAQEEGEGPPSQLTLMHHGIGTPSHEQNHTQN